MAIKKPSLWSENELEQWLFEQNQSEMAIYLKEARMDGLLFLQLTDEEIVNQLKIIDYFQTKKLKLFMKYLQEMEYNFTSEEKIELERENSKNSNSSQSTNCTLSLNSSPENSVNLQNFSIQEKQNSENWQLVMKPVNTYNYGKVPQNYFVNETSVRIGRNNEQNEIVVPDLTISRQHAQVRKTSSNSYKLIDYTSQNGTFKKLLTKHQLQENNEYDLGSNKFIVLQIRKNFPNDKNVITLQQKSNGQIYNLPINKQYQIHYIGKNEKNSISLSQDNFLNEFHAKIYKEHEQFYIEDLGSINGTWLRLKSQYEYQIENDEVYKFGQNLQYQMQLIKQNC